MEENSIRLEALLEKAGEYGKTSIELVKLKVLDKSSDVISSCIPNSVVLVLIASFMIFLNFGLAFWLGEILGKIYYGFFVVAGFYLFSGFFVHFFMHKWLKRKVCNYIIKTVLKIKLMQKISPANRLKYEIERLEELQSIQGRQLKEQFYMTYESLKPINLLKNTLKDISNSPYLIDNIIGTGMGMVSGFLTKKIFVGVSGSMFRKLIGSVLQLGVTNVVAQNSDIIRSFGQFVIQRFILKKKNED